MSADILLAVSIFVGTFALIVLRPAVPVSLQRVFGPEVTVGQATIVGACLTALAGLVTLQDLFHILRIVAWPMAVLLGLSIIALSAGQTGFFEWASLTVARGSSGRAPILFARIFWLSTLFTVMFPNDATILIFTPLVILMLKNIRLDWWSSEQTLPFLFAVIFGANAGSITLMTSNPINLIAGSHFGISFLEYAKWMVLPGIASALACRLMLHLALRKQIPASYLTADLAEPESAILDRPLFNLSILVMAGVLVAYFVLPLLGISFHVAVLVGAGTILIAVAINRKTSAWRVVKGNPWDEIIFVVGLFVVVFGLKNAGLTEALGRVMKAAAGSSPYQAILSTLGITFLGTSLTNDWPMIMISSLSIEAIDTLPVAYRSFLPFAAVMGADLGAYVVPSASLATLIWMGIIRRMTDQKISWWRFIRIGIIVTPATLLAAALALCLEAYLFL